MRRAVVLCCLLCLSAPAAAAAAASARPSKQSSLQRAQKLVDKLRYKEALPVLQQAVEDAALEPQAHREALALLGTVQVILDDEPAARQTFARLLGEAPEHRLDESLSPKILDVYEAVRLQLYPPLRAVVEVPLRLVEQGDSAALELDVGRHGEGLLRVQLYLREAGGQTWAAQSMVEQPPGHYRAELGPRPPPGQDAHALEAWAQVLGPDGGVLATSGEASTPLALQVTPQPALATTSEADPSVWLWVGAGTGLALLAAGAAVTTVLLLNLPAEEPPASLGTYTLD